MTMYFPVLAPIQDGRTVAGYPDPEPGISQRDELAMRIFARGVTTLPMGSQSAEVVAAIAFNSADIFMKMREKFPE